LHDQHRDGYCVELGETALGRACARSARGLQRESEAKDRNGIRPDESGKEPRASSRNGAPRVTELWGLPGIYQGVGGVYPRLYAWAVPGVVGRGYRHLHA
jgi:hypothetical protein